MSLFMLPNIECCQCGEDSFREGDTVFFRHHRDGEPQIRCEECSRLGDRPAAVRRVVEASRN